MAWRFALAVLGAALTAFIFASHLAIYAMVGAHEATHCWTSRYAGGHGETCEIFIAGSAPLLDENGTLMPDTHAYTTAKGDLLPGEHAGTFILEVLVCIGLAFPGTVAAMPWLLSLKPKVKVSRNLQLQKGSP